MEKRWPPERVKSLVTPSALRRRAIRRPPCTRVDSCAWMVMAGQSIPPARGVKDIPPWSRRGRPPSVKPERAGRDSGTVDDPKIQITDVDLELLLAQADHEDRLLSATLLETPPREPREALDLQILGG